jgi:sensor domain CHASE-containing protein/signal transduction histidine kinase
VLAVFAIVGLISFGSLGAGAHFLVTTRFKELEARWVSVNLDRMEEVIADQMSLPASKIKDWANGDDTFDFARNGTEKYIETNLIPSTLDNIKIDSLRIYGLKGEKIAGIEASPVTDTGTTRELGEILDELVAESPNIVADTTATEVQKGWVFRSGNLFAYASLPIRQGTGEGESAGVMIFFKRADNKFLERVSELTKFTVDFQTATRDSAKHPEESSDFGKAHVLPSKLPGISEKWFLPLSEDEIRIAARAKDFNNVNFGSFQAQLPREIRAEGERTLDSLLCGAAAMLAAMFIALLIALERFVIGRILGLNRSIESVSNPITGGTVSTVGTDVSAGASGDGPKIDFPGTAPQRTSLTQARTPWKHSSRVPAMGKDEVGDLSNAINAMLDTVDEKNRSIQEIIANVQSGFLMVDKDGIILEAHTDYCLKLLERDSIAGLPVADLLFGTNMQRRDRQTFDFLLSQIFDDILPEETSTGQLPSSINNGTRWFAISVKVIRGDQGTIKSVLFTISDVTAVKATERKIEEIQALLQILRSKEVFGAFIDGLPENLDRLRLYVGIADQVDQATQASKTAASGGFGSTRPLDARKLLHTLKGNFAMFGLGETARRIHQIEDTRSLTVEQIDSIEAACTRYLDEYYELLGIRYGSQREANYNISAAALEKLNRIAHQSALTSIQLRKAIGHFIQASKLTRIDKALEPIAGAGELLAHRLGKDVDIKIEPSPLLVDYATCHGIFEALINSILNAIDHGIEQPEQRQLKPKRGSIIVRASRTPDDLIIEVSDDGRGIDFERLGQVLSDKEICSNEEFNSLTEPEKLEYLFRGNISTAATVSEISGRGLGLAGLRNEARNLGGDVHILTTQGKGTTITVSIPLRRPEARLVA